MVTYTVDSGNWNDPAFWSSINQSSGDHTFDFFLSSAFTVNFDEAAGTITITNGGSTFVIGEGGYTGPSNVNLGGTTQLSYFTTLLGTDGSDTISSGDADSGMRGYAGNDSMVGGSGDDILLGDSGNDTLEGGGGADTIRGGSGADSLVGGAGDDTLEGGSGNDILLGGDGNDTMRGGTGSDQMFGGAGSDFFYVTSEFTNEIIEGGESAGDADVIALIGSFANPASVNFTGDDSGTLTSGSSTITFDEIEGLNLTDGNDTVTGAAATDGLWIEADGGADSIITGSGSDVVYGGAGADTVQTGAGADTVYGGFGADSLTGGDGDDLMIGGSGIDTLAGGSGNDTIFGDLAEMGRDAGTINGFTFDAANISESGTELAGNGEIGSYAIYDNVGTTSDGTIVQAKLTLVESDDPTVDVEYSDGVRLGYNNAGAAGTRMTFEMQFFDQTTGEAIALDGALTFKDIDTTSESVTFAATDAASVSVSATPVSDLTVINTPEQIGAVSNANSSTSADEDHWAQFALTDQNTVEFTVTTRGAGTIYNFGSDSFTNPPATTASTPEAQNDSIIGEAGDDVLYGGTGDDTLRGGAGNDTIYGGTGADQMFGGGDEDRFVIQDGFGADTIAGRETTTTATDFDTLDLTNLTGPVTVTSSGAEAGTATDGTDTLIFSEIEAIETGAGADSINTTADGSGLFISAGDGADTVLAGSGDDTVFGGDGADSIDLGAGNDSYGDFAAASGGDDTVLGGAGDDYIIEQAGNDSILGGIGNDTLSGGIGNDTLLGGDDADTFLITDDHETDVITGGEGGTDFDSVVFSNFISLGGVNVLFDGDEQGSYSYTATPGAGTFTEIEGVTGTAYGDNMNASASSQSQTMSGGAGDDTLTGGSGNDTLSGGADADTIDGGDGDDSLSGDAGDDTFLLNAGSDTVSGGAGNDNITAGSGDSIEAGDGDDTINVSNADLNGGTIFVDGGSGGETLGDTLNITGPAVITPGGTGSGTVEFLDGTTLTYSNIETVNYVPCFTPGTLIKTDRGEVPVEHLAVGDRVLTRDNGFQAIRWIGARAISRAELVCNSALAPVTIRKGALGANVPLRDLTVSPQHRVLREDAMAELMFGEAEVLIPATNLTHLEGIAAHIPEDGIRYIHFMFDQHEIVQSDGCWTESFQPGDKTLDAITDEARDELFAIFPELRDLEGQIAFQAARATLKSYQSRALLAA